MPTEKERTKAPRRRERKGEAYDENYVEKVERVERVGEGVQARAGTENEFERVERAFRRRPSRLEGVGVSTRAFGRGSSCQWSASVVSLDLTLMLHLNTRDGRSVGEVESKPKS